VARSSGTEALDLAVGPDQQRIIVVVRHDKSLP
jgi:hypothetical protein